MRDWQRPAAATGPALEVSAPLAGWILLRHAGSDWHMCISPAEWAAFLAAAKAGEFDDLSP